MKAGQTTLFYQGEAINHGFMLSCVKADNMAST